MLFGNHLVNIAYIHEEGMAMAQIRIHVLHCGKIGVAPNLPASAQWRWPAKADARRLKSGARIWLPVSAYLVEHPKGLFLVDAGLPRTVSPTGIEDRAAQLRMFGRGWYTLVHSVVEPEQSIGEQLAARGIRPQDLDYVLFSHLDPDHIAGISEVRGAKRLLVAEEEYFWSCRVNLRYTSRKLWMDEPPERFWYRVNHIGPESRSYDLFGDDSVHLVHIAGHTEGMFATLIRNGGRYVLLNADGAASPRSWAEGTVPGICENSVRAKKALDWIGEMSRDGACAASLCSHDPDVTPQTIEL